MPNVSLALILIGTYHLEKGSLIIYIGVVLVFKFYDI